MQHDRMGFVDGIAHTPHLDALAAEGVHFTHAITQQGQCVPSRAVMLTGQQRARVRGEWSSTVSTATTTG